MLHFWLSFSIHLLHDFQFRRRKEWPFGLIIYAYPLDFGNRLSCYFYYSEQIHSVWGKLPFIKTWSWDHCNFSKAKNGWIDLSMEAVTRANIHSLTNSLKTLNVWPFRCTGISQILVPMFYFIFRNVLHSFYP